MRPVLSMPGSAYANIGKQVAYWLSQIPECRINCSTKEISDFAKNTILPEGDILVSFDVTSLYTNVPVTEAITYCAELFFDKHKLSIDGVSKETFIKLLELSSCDVVMSTHEGYYIQKEGLAMGSAPAPHIANAWLSKYDDTIKGESILYFRYMDDIIQNIKEQELLEKLHNINHLHKNLTFTSEREKENSLAFVDMEVLNNKGVLTTKWYRKPTDTGLMMNFHSLAPLKYKRSVVIGSVHRIFRACSTWQLFHEGILELKQLLINNQYPPAFFEPLINSALTKLIEQPQKVHSEVDMEKDHDPYMLFLNYRGKCSETFAKDLYRICNDPNEPRNEKVRIIFTLKKLKTVLPQLKPQIPRMLRSGNVYQIDCPGCNARYVGQTVRHLQTRFG